jgi:hypothetical protein
MDTEKYKVGQIYNILEALEFFYKYESRCKRNILYVKTRCIKCGAIKIMRAQKLYYKTHNSCSCQTKTSLGLYKTKIYSIWGNMKDRCFNSKCKEYKNYGGRGIKVCDEWKNNFVAFYNWAMTHGYKEGLSIDRIDNDGNYEPSNCQWLTVGENVAKANPHNFRHKPHSGKQYYIVSPNQNVYIFPNANKFCREHQELLLDANTLREVCRKPQTRSHFYKDWYCDYYDEESCLRYEQAIKEVK